MNNNKKYEYTLEYFENWLNSTTEYIFFKDLNGIYTNAAKATANLAGFDNAKKMIGKTDKEIYPAELAEKFIAQDKKVLKEKKAIKIEEYIIHKEKGKILVETIKSPIFNTNGEIIGIQGISRDISEKENTLLKSELQETQLIAILNNIPFPIWLKNMDNKYVLINRAYEKFYNVKKENIIGKDVENALLENHMIDSNEISSLLEDDKKVLTTKTIKHRPITMTINNEEKYINLIKTPILSQNNDCLGLLGLSYDNSNKINYEKLLAEQKIQEEENTKLKNDFIANISHEIRTPMNGILGFLEILSGTELDENQREYVQEAQKSGNILLSLISDILDLAQVESGKLKMDKISFNLRYVIEDIATIAASNIGDKPIEINALCYSDLPERILGDPSRLKQVLNNFVNNAIKFTNEGEINITVKLVEQLGNQAKILFKIQDTGIGISEENQAKIFESFTQADSSTTKKYSGSGLGLTISKNIIEMLNGEIFLHSVLDAGSTFSFTACFDIDQKENSSFDYELPNIQDKKILIFDDNRTNLKVLEYYLGNYNCETDVAIDAISALNKLNDNTNDYDVILTDFCMPNIDGMEFAVMAKKLEKYKNIPIILLTSRAQIGDYKSAKAIKLNGYLPKPIRKKDLADCIAMVLEEKENKNKKLITKHTLKEYRRTTIAKILVVEDNPLNQKLLTKMLTKAGVICDIASNGLEALNACQDNSYDLIFMDCQMPIMDGFEATKAIIAKGINSPIIAMSSNLNDEDIKKCIACGMKDTLPKPLNYNLLVEKIDKFIPEKPKQENDTSIDITPYTSMVGETKKSIAALVEKDLNIPLEEALELVEEFTNDALVKVNNIEEAICNLDVQKVILLAHSIRGAAGNLKMDLIFEYATDLEKSARNNDMSEAPMLARIMKNYLTELR